MTVPAITKYASSALTTISLPPHSTPNEALEDNAIEFSSPSNLSQWLYIDAFMGRLWSITVPCLTTTQKETLVTFWKARKGRVIPFKWVHPTTGITHYVRFSSTGLSFDRITGDFFTCSFTLSEAHTLEINIVD